MKGMSGVYRLEHGGWEVDKHVLGTRLRATFGSQREAMAWASKRCEEVRRQKRFGERPDILFEAAIQRYLEDKLAANMPSVTTDVYLFKPLLPFVGHLRLSEVSNSSFNEFRLHRAREGMSAKTIRSSLSAAKTVLNLAEKEWRVPGTNLSYLARAPSISLPKLAGKQRPPRPISWMEQDDLVPKLPFYLAQMTLFVLNTGVRDEPLVNLRWEWLVRIPALDTYVFLVPARYVKGRQSSNILVLNSTAKSIVEAQRGRHEEYVFVWRREREKHPDKPPKMEFRPVATANNTAWQSARTRAGLGDLHFHDLRHTFAMRLNAAGVSERTTADLLWHAKTTVTQHYMTNQLRALELAVERIVARPELENVAITALMQGTKRAAP